MDNKKIQKIARHITKEYSEALEGLAQGPHGEYVHELEAKLAEAYKEIEKLKKERDDARRAANDAKRGVFERP